MPDWRDPNITFPVNIPIKYHWVYRPTKTVERIEPNDFINFSRMSGNEILLNLENYAHLRPTEFSSALFELSRKPGSQGKFRQL